MGLGFRVPTHGLRASIRREKLKPVNGADVKVREEEEEKKERGGKKMTRESRRVTSNELTGVVASCNTVSLLLTPSIYHS
jgi:hypothetical protein